MAGMGDVMGDAGEPPAIKAGGRVWRVGHPTQKCKQLLENLVIEAAEDRALARREARPETFQLYWDRHEAAFHRGEYETVTGAKWLEAVTGPDGGALLLAALLRAHHPEATLADAYALLASEPDQTRLAMARVMPPFFTALAEAVLAGDRFRHAPQAAKDAVRKGVQELAARMGETLSA